MPINVDVVSKEDYAKWLAERQEAAKAASAGAPAATTAANNAASASATL
jgi:heme/copper-type cytochrome/quinol oxidase subunit 2